MKIKPNFNDLVTSYIKLVYFFTRKCITDQEDADDIVSQTFMKAYIAYKQPIFTSEKALKSWLLAICHNTIKNFYRNQKKKYAFLDENNTELVTPESENILNTIIHKEHIEAVQKIISTLAPIEQELIHLRIYEEFSFDEIAHVFNTNQARIKMRFYRTLRKIKEAYETQTATL